jgi:hypothetical protein
MTRDRAVNRVLAHGELDLARRRAAVGPKEEVRVLWMPDRECVPRVSAVLNRTMPARAAYVPACFTPSSVSPGPAATDTTETSLSGESLGMYSYCPGCGTASAHQIWHANQIAFRSAPLLVPAAGLGDVDV